MSDPARIPRILSKLAALWGETTSSRFVDVLANVLDLSDEPDDSEVHTADDDFLERRLDETLAAFSGVASGPADPALLTLHYRGCVGTVERDDATAVIHGRLADIRDVVTFQGVTLDEVGQAFQDSVDDYLAFCEQRGEEPDAPASNPNPNPNP